MSKENSFDRVRNPSELCPIDVRINEFCWLNLALHTDEFDEGSQDKNWLKEALGIYG
jgi:hypothetical protein